jgi:nucleotide-binding universal stress UspA family protein
MSSDPIVAGTDGSASAELAVDRAGELAHALDAPVHVVTVLAAASATGAGDKIVADSRERLETRGVTVQTHIRSGDPAAELIKLAQAERAQMIVLGNRGMTGGPARRILGSVPNDVSHHAHCDVLIVTTRP